MLNELLEKIGARRHEEQLSATARYRDLITREGELSDRDAGELEQLMTALGKSPEDVVADAGIVKRARELDELAKQLPARQAALKSAVLEASDYGRTMRESVQGMEEQFAALESKRTVAGARLTQSGSAVDELTALRKSRPDLFE